MAKTYGNIYEQILTFSNLVLAYEDTRKRKKSRLDVQLFHNNALGNLQTLHEELCAGTWQLSPCRCFTVYNEVKQRDIVAPIFRDRIVHHAIHRILEPLFEKKFIFDSYSCRKGKGTHAAVQRLQEFLKRAQAIWPQVYVLKCDIAKFFPSVSHSILLSLLAQTLRQQSLLCFLSRATLSPHVSVGIPIGALTSQLYANIMLNPLDHFIKEKLKCVFYLRYADDFILLAPTKELLHQQRLRIEAFLNKLHLKLNKKSGLFPVKQGVDFCGYRVWAGTRLPRKRVVQNAKKQLQHYWHKYIYHALAFVQLQCRWAALVAYLNHAGCYLLFLLNFLFSLFLTGL